MIIQANEFKAELRDGAGLEELCHLILDEIDEKYYGAILVNNEWFLDFAYHNLKKYNEIVFARYDTYEIASISAQQDFDKLLFNVILKQEER
jgi:hypothetical protein